NVYDKYGKYYTWENVIYFEKEGNYELTITLIKKPAKTVKISGKVLTSYGQPVEYASIDFKLIGTYKNDVSFGIMSNKSGYYVTDLTPGIYNISCSYSGMNTSYVELNLVEGMNYT
ncbi:MAG: carboxypeptidase-like regulatory domain-containing protein, partial [Thermoplasmata archaeon]